MASLVRFVLEHTRGRGGPVESVETTYRHGGADCPASVYRPAGGGRRPAWILLHGITYTGREHPELVRLARSVAAAGFVVLVPDVPEWRNLRVAPDETVPTLVACVDALAARDDVDADRIGVLGFSFGATLALSAATEPELRDRLAGVASWGGYGDMHEVVRFLFTGHHELDGERWFVEPDPYGRWILGANYLRAVPEWRERGDVAAALFELAADAGRRRIFAGDPIFDPVKVRLREGLSEEARAVFDLFAWPPGRPRPDESRLLEVVETFNAAVTREDPRLAELDRLSRIRVPVVLAHGREDALVPFTHLERLKRRLPEDRVRAAAVTGLYSHSSGGSIESRVGRLVEPARYLLLLRSLLNLI